MSDLQALIEKLEAATEGSRELDAEIALACGWRFNKGTVYSYHWLDPQGAHNAVPSPFTESLDAALTLVPEGWGYQQGSHPRAACKACAFCFEGADDFHNQPPSFAPTPALALCIAALKARAAQ
jgi:hypothetical protein